VRTRCRDFETAAGDGATLLLRWYTKNASAPGSAVLYLHGGGMILSNVTIYDGPVARYVSATGVPFLSVEYRYAPEHPAPTPVTDGYAGLEWLVAHATELGVDPERIAIMGDSGGGGVAASLAIYARDYGAPAIAKQILLYPMLDDCNTMPDPELAAFATWTYDDNATGWARCWVTPSAALTSRHTARQPDLRTSRDSRQSWLTLCGEILEMRTIRSAASWRSGRWTAAWRSSAAGAPST
jgi:acetyl esterase/lipase